MTEYMVRKNHGTEEVVGSAFFLVQQRDRRREAREERRALRFSDALRNKLSLIKMEDGD